MGLLHFIEKKNLFIYTVTEVWPNGRENQSNTSTPSPSTDLQ